MIKFSQVAYLHGYKGMVSFLFLQMSCTIDIIFTGYRKRLPILSALAGYEEIAWGFEPIRNDFFKNRSTNDDS